MTSTKATWKIFNVEFAESGKVCSVQFDPSDGALSIGKLKHQLSSFSEVTPENQVLLVGPPFRQLDKLFGPDFVMRDGERIFLYNKSVFTGDFSPPSEIRLFPHEIPIPDSIPEFSSSFASLIGRGTSPLLKALIDYERSFLQSLKRGESYLIGSEQSLASMRRALKEHGVQGDAFAAALSNLKDHFTSCKSTFSEGKILSKLEKHALLLKEFPSYLQRLSSIHLHPSLVSSTANGSNSDSLNDISSRQFTSYISSNTFDECNATIQANNRLAQRSQSSSSSSSSSASISDGSRPRGSNDGRPQSSSYSIKRNSQLTLLSCVQVDKELSWFQNCQEAHSKVQNQLNQLNSKYSEISIGIAALEEPLFDLSKLLSSINKSESIVTKQQECMEALREDYQFVYNSVATKASVVQNGVGATDESDLVALLSKLEGRRVVQETNVLGPMESQCMDIMTLKNEFAASKSRMTRLVFKGMQAIASIQTEIQRNIKDGLQYDMKLWYKGHNKYFSELERVAKLPEAYEKFLWEIVRRQAFNKLYKARVCSVIDDLARLRTQETSRRAIFKREQWHYLPMKMTELVPSLDRNPPYFDAKLTSEEETLPEISSRDASQVSAQVEISLFDAVIKTSSDPGETAKNDDNDKATNARAEDMFQISTTMPEFDCSGESLTERCRRLEYENSELLARIAELSKRTTHISSVGTLLSPSVGAGIDLGVGGPYSMPTTALDVTSVDQIGSAPASLVDAGNNPKSNLHLHSDVAAVSDPGQLTTCNPSTVVTSPRRNGNTGSTDNSPVETGSSEVVPNSSLVDLLIAGIMTIKTTLELDEDAVDLNSPRISRKTIALSSFRTEQISEQKNSTGLDEDLDHIKIDETNLSAASFDASINRSTLSPDDIATYVEDTIWLVEKTKRSFIRRIQALKMETQETAEIQSKREALREKLNNQNMTISFRDFDCGHIALFFPTSVENDKYVAFHLQCPHRYLSPESLQNFRASSRTSSRNSNRWNYLLGRIVFMQTHVADFENNPFALPLGTEFHLLDVEHIAISPV